MIDEELKEAILALVDAQTWEELKQVIDIYRNILLTDRADRALTTLVEMSAAGGDAESSIRFEMQRTLLEYCRREGIEAAFADYTRPPEAVIMALEAFVNAETWEESKEIVLNNHDEVFNYAVNQIFDDFFTQYEHDKSMLQYLEEHRALLARCRQEDIEAAFAAFYRWLQRDDEALFAGLPDRTRLLRLLQVHQDWYRRLLAEASFFTVIDSYPIELLFPMREGRSPQQVGKKGKEKGRWTVGIKLCWLLNEQGQVVDWDGATLNTHDQHFHPLIVPYEGRTIVLGDFGFRCTSGIPANCLTTIIFAAALPHRTSVHHTGCATSYKQASSIKEKRPLMRGKPSHALRRRSLCL